MASFNRDGATMRLTETQRMLASVAYPLPKPVTTALERISAHDALEPVEATAQTLRQVYLATPDPATIAEHAARAAAAHLLRSAWSEARIDLHVAAMNAIRDRAPDILDHLADRANEIIADITWWATAGMPNAGALLGHNKVADAKRAAAIDANWVELMSLRKLRAAVTPRDFPWVRLAFRTEVEHVKPGDLPDTARAIQDGAELWWPTWDEAVAAQQEIERADTEKAKANQQQRRLEYQSAL